MTSTNRGPGHPARASHHVRTARFATPTPVNPVKELPLSFFRPPDFELYDNVGRTTEQIHAYNTNTPTRDDLHRWAARDAKQFTDSLDLPPTGQTITAWTDLLHRARTAAEFHAITDAVVGDEHGALSALHQFLEEAATWCEHQQDPEMARRYRRIAQQLAELGDQLTYLGEDHLAATYTRPAPATEGRDGPAPPPPPAGPRPGQGRSR